MIQRFVGAVEEGRIILSNIVRFIHYLFSGNFSEILTVFAAIMLGWPLPLGALQMNRVINADDLNVRHPESCRG